MTRDHSRFDVALGVVGVVFATVTLAMASWYIATVDSIPDTVPWDRWLLVGVVIGGVVVMAVTSYRYFTRYSPSRESGLVTAGWIVAALAVPLSLFAWGDDPHMAFSVHLSEAAGAAALVGWLAFGLCAAAILLAAQRHPSSTEDHTGIDHRAHDTDRSSTAERSRPG